MAKDLAIDVGIPVDSNEYETFVGCVNNILTHGCGYDDEVTESIMEKCHTSNLPIAQEVLRECRRISRNTSGIRPSRLKWWEKYHRKKDGDVPRWPGKRADRQQAKRPNERKRPNKRQNESRKRPMSPMFTRKRPCQNESRQRPMSTRKRSWQNESRKRPMSPMFTRKRPYENSRNDDSRRHQGSRRYQRSPSPVYNTKKRRYR